jgi:LysM repeat protein
MLNKSLIAFLSVAPIFSWAQTQYVVRKGDTLLKIADRTLGNSKTKDSRRYELAKKIRNLNPNLKDPNALEPGQVITIPSEVTTEAATESKIESTDKPAPPAELKAAKDEKTVPLTPPTHPPVTLAEPVPPIAEQPTPPVPPQVPVLTATPPVPPSDATSDKQESKHSNFILIQPRLQTLQIDAKELATETKATLKSQSSAGIDLQYGVVLSKRIHLLFQVGATQTEFNNIEGVEGITVNHKTETLNTYALGVAFEATHKVHLDLMIMQAERTFLLPEVLPAYLLEKVAIPGAEFNVSWDVYSGASNIFGISAIAEYIGELKKDNIEYKSTVEPMIALYWKSDRGSDRINYKMTLTYKTGHQDTNVTEQKEDLAVFGVGFYL